MRILFCTIILSIGHFLSAQGIEFFEGQFNDALQKARTENKLIFVDAYADWCGPCKRMAKLVFTQEVVGNYYNENFINVKMNVETPQGKSFRKEYPLSSLPTLFFINGDGEVVHKAVGGKSEDQLINLGNVAKSKINTYKEFALQYEEGKRDPELILNYVVALIQSNKSAHKIANEYLRKNETLNDETSLRIIKEACVDSDSRIFNLLVDKKSELLNFYTKEEIEEVMLNACHSTSQKAIDFQVYDLQEQAKETVAKYIPTAKDTFSFQTDMDYFLALKDVDNYLSISQKYLSSKNKKDIIPTIEVAENIMQFFYRSNKATKTAEKWVSKVVSTKSEGSHQFLYSQLLAQNQKTKEAVKYAKLAMEQTQDKKLKSKIEQFLTTLKS